MSTVDHPAHYGGADNPYETINVIEAWDLGFHLGNVVKYIARAEGACTASYSRRPLLSHACISEPPQLAGVSHASHGCWRAVGNQTVCKRGCKDRRAEVPTDVSAVCGGCMTITSVEVLYTYLPTTVTLIVNGTPCWRERYQEGPWTPEMLRIYHYFIERFNRGG